jgi:Skp family chaperone for outer membrane proteins
MKKSFLLLMILTCAGLAGAQGTAAQTPVPTGKIAVIYSQAFQDPTNGIARYAATVNKLNAEFKTIQDDLGQTAARLRAMKDEIDRMQQGTPAAVSQ